MLYFQGFQLLECVLGGLSHLPNGPLRAQQLREFDPLQVIADVAPGICAGRFRHALEQQGEHG